MNLRKSAVQLFLLASTATHTGFAFVVPSALVISSGSLSRYETSYVTFEPARPTALKVTDKIFEDLGLTVEAYEKGEGDEDDYDKSIKVLEGIVTALESLDDPKSTFLDDTTLVEGPISRMPLSEAISPASISPSDVAEFKKTESAIAGVHDAIDFLKRAIDDYKRFRSWRSYKGKISYATYSAHPEFPDFDLSGMMKMMDGPPPFEYIFSIRKIIRILKRRSSFNIGMKLTKKRVEREVGEEMFKAFFTKFSNLVQKPKLLIETWEDDKEQARQFLAGVNPVMICVAKELSQLSSNIISQFGEDKLQGLIDEKRLFYVSYDAIADLKKNPHQGWPKEYNSAEWDLDDPRPFYAPIAVFELDEKREELDIMGIQLEREDDSKVFTAQGDNENDWLMAKCHLATTDSNIHEWVSHLGKTHLTMEPHIIAIHNTLKNKNHKLANFFDPLIQDTLLLNYAARDSLAAFKENSWGDKQSSIGVGQYMQINYNWWQTYDFFESSGLPQELASRGFDEDFDMPSYLFREDGLKLWKAIGSFAEDFVDEIFVSDADVANDEIVQEWATETTAPDKAAVPGFPSSIKDKATLVKIMQTIMWITSGLHAAVNFPQYDYYAFVPNKPLFMKKLLPPTDRKDIFEKGLPGKFLIADDDPNPLLQILNTLTLPSETCVDNLNKKFSDVGEKSYTKFQKELDGIGQEIEARNKINKENGKHVYSYLNPTVVPASIDI